MPPLTVVPPVYVLGLVKTSVPPPDLASEPPPLITPAKVELRLSLLPIVSVVPLGMIAVAVLFNLLAVFSALMV